MKILIVGGGMGGLAFAAFLTDSPIEYDIVEKCPDWTHQGFLITVWDNGRDILEKLGLAEAFDRMGTRVKEYLFCDGKGGVIRSHSFEDLYAAYGGAATIVNRAELHALLLGKIRAGKLRMNLSVEKIEETEDGVRVTLTNGETKNYDLVVGADGVHSAVRKMVFGKDTERATRWRAWYGWIDERFDQPGAIGEYVELGRLVVTFSAGGKTNATFFAPADPNVREETKGRIERMKEIFKAFPAFVPSAFVDKKDEDFMPTDLFDVDLPSWVKGCTVLLGDAAHCFGPVTGMGSSMAMEDAYVLAAHLLRVPKTESLPEALRAYEMRRQKRIAIVKRMTHLNRPVLMTVSKRRRRVFDFFLRYIPRVPSGRSLKSLLAEEI